MTERQTRTDGSSTADTVSPERGHPSVPEELQRTVRRFFDRARHVILIFGLLAVAAGALRVMDQGLRASYVVNIVTLLALLPLVYLHRRVPFHALATASVATIIINAAAALCSLGLASMGIAMFLCSCVIVVLSHGRRAGLVVAAICTLLLTGIGIGVVNGVFTTDLNVESFVRSPWTWGSRITGFLLFALVITVAASNVYERLTRSLAETREREQRYRLLAENMIDGLFVIDLDFHVQYLSPSILEMFGYEDGEMDPLRLDVLLAPDSYRLAMEDFQRSVLAAAPDARAVPLREYECVRKDGSTFWSELRMTLLRGADGTLNGLQGIMRDIGERKDAELERERLEAELRQAEKLQAIGQLAGGIAHDFNNQLVGVVGNAELLLEDLADRPAARARAESILQVSERAADLTRKLLAFARKGQFESVAVDVHTIVGEVAGIIERGVKKTIAIETELAAESQSTIGDPTQIQNAILNVALNACDAMPAGGTLTFATEVATLESGTSFESGLAVDGGSYLRLGIADTGKGMDEAIQRYIFDPFFTTKPQGEGTGMGLAALYGTMRTHHGTIELRSAPGEGTEFGLYFPLAECATEGAEARPAPPSRPHDAPPAGRILVVDDEDIVRRVQADQLAMLGYDVESCATGREALEIYREGWERFDAVVLDFMLTDSTGNEVLRELREVNADVPVLVSSGFGPEDQVQELLGQPRTGFIGKPSSLSAFSEALTKLLRNS
jgi:PAS domain S-box-containing protein